jgi:hypothetical protein
LPYKSSDIPGGTEKVPAHGRAIYRAAFNAAYEKYGKERAHAIAWAATKRKYKKKGDRWVSKDGYEALRVFEDFDPDQPRDPQGKWTSGGGSAGGLASTGGALPSGGFGILSSLNHPGHGYSKEAYEDDKGVIHTTKVEDAVRALYEKKKVELNQPREVSTLIEHLGEVAAHMVKMGGKTPVFNLCDASVKGTNLFCAQSKGIPRVKMPQLTDQQTADFKTHLSGSYKVEDTSELASHLRATQDELNGAKVANAAKAIQTNPDYAARRIMVSRDNYILDGHHSWAGHLAVDAMNGVLGDKQMNITRVDIPIVKLLDEAEKFTGGKGKKGVGDRRFDGDQIMRDKEFSTEQRKKLAKTGAAMKGGGFPIESEQDLKNAIHAIGRAKNPAAAKAHIKTRARALGKTELLPENWDSKVAWADEARELVDAWLAIEDAHPCPKCDGAGQDGYGFKCKGCDGEGYVKDDAMQDGVVQMTDSFLIDRVRRTKDGYMVCDARIARTGVQLYAGDEIGAPDMEVVRVYRPPEEVFSSAAMHSLAHRPITLTHPPVMVDADNWKDYAVGHTGDEVTRDGDCVRVPMVIMDSKAIEAYQKHGVKELSVGYSTDLKWGKGRTPDGDIYDAKQTAIRGNHLAVVPAARGGSRLCIGDDEEKGEVVMVKLLIDGQTIEFTDELVAKHVQGYLSTLQKTIADQKKKIDEDDDDDEEEEEKKTRAEKDAMTGEIAALKKQLEDANAKLNGKNLDAIVKERTDLLLKAHAAMDGKADFDGKEPAEIRRTVVMAKMGDAAKDLTDAEVVGAFKILTANIKPSTGVDRLADNLSLLNLSGGARQNDPRAIKDAAYDEYTKNLSNAWRGPRVGSQ